MQSGGIKLKTRPEYFGTGGHGIQSSSIKTWVNKNRILNKTSNLKMDFFRPWVKVNFGLVYLHVR